jgi:replicative superfamily II helicase
MELCENMKRPLYTEFEFRILEFLATKTDNGSALRKTLATTLKIPKASMTDVLTDLSKRGLVKRVPWWKNQEKIEISDAGRKEYNNLASHRPQFPIPIPVQGYLRSRKPRVTTLFPIQQMFADRGLIFSKDNVCVFGYPGSGKTLIAEMVMANELHNDGKILYVTPYKALDWQKYSDFKQWFGENGTKVVISDGDHRIPTEDLESAGIIIGTYEAIYGALRRNESWVENTTAIIADEISLIGEDRGGTVDLLLTELASQQQSPRIIALSSLVGNPFDLAGWLGAQTVIENRPAPGVTLSEYVVYQDSNKSATLLNRNGKIEKVDVNGPVVEHIVKSHLSKGETTLIFVGGRAQTQFVAQHLKHLSKRDESLAKEVSEFLEREKPIRTELTRELCELLEYGVAFHHAGLQRKARRFIERLVNEGKVKIVVATTTLSHGVDYRIDSVIIDLRSLVEVKTHDLQGYEYINLKGRTGRIGKSRSASVYIFCDHKRANRVFKKYFLGSPEPILPETTFDPERLSSTILLEASEHDIKASELLKTMRKTLGFKRHHLTKKKLANVLTELFNSGFIARRQNEYRITDLGRKANDISLAPFEVKRILELKSDSTDAEILEVAANIDLAGKVRSSGTSVISNAKRQKVVELVLSGKTIDEIRIECNGYDDQDILDLVRYTQLSLSKMSEVSKDVILNRKLHDLRSTLDQNHFGHSGSFAETTFISTR